MTNSESTYRDLLRVPGFAPLVISGLFERLATQIFAVLLVLFVLNEYGSSSLSGLAVLTSQLPGLIASPFAGALLDRSRLTLILTTNYSVSGIYIAAIGILALVHALSIPTLFIIAGIGSFTQPLCRVGGRSLYPAIVPRALWDRSNAVDSGGFVIASVFGPSIAGIAYAIVGPQIAMFVPAALMVTGAVLIRRVKLPATNTTPRNTLVGEALAAVNYVFHNRVIRMLAGTITLVNIALGGINVIIAVLVKYRLHGGGVGTGLLIAITGVAAFAAGFTVARFGTEGREKRVLALGCAGLICSLVILSISHSYLLAAIGMAGAGISNGPLTVAMLSLRQRATDPAWFGRAFAVSINLNFAGMPIGAAIAGLLTAGHTTAIAFLVGAGFVAFGGLWPTVLPASVYVPQQHGTTQRRSAATTPDLSDTPKCPSTPLR